MSESQQEQKIIKYKNFRFFYYMKREHLEYFLQTGNVKVTQLSRSNDPLEFMFNIKGDDAFYSWHHNEPLVLCLSTRVTSRSLWGHHADAHKGVCLVFDIPLESSVSDSYDKTIRKYGIIASDAKDIGKSYLYQVKYVEDRHVVKLTDDINNEPEKRLNFLCKQYINAISTKSKDWEFENEFRVYISDYSSDLVCDKGLLFYSGLKGYFKGVVIGLNCDVPDAYVEKLVGGSQFSTAFVTRASIHPQKYKMRISPFNKKDVEDTSVKDIEDWKTVEN